MLIFTHLDLLPYSGVAGCNSISSKRIAYFCQIMSIVLTLYALLRKKNSMIMPSSSAVGSGFGIFLIANPYTGILIHGDSNLSKPKKIWIILKAWNKCHALRDSFSLLFAMKHPKNSLLFRFFVYFFVIFCCETP